MKVADRGASSVIGVILMVAVVVILAAIVSVAAFGFMRNINEPAPNVADTAGEFEAGADSDEQNVRITHLGGEPVPVEDIEIIVRATGPGSELPTEARLVDLPAGVTRGFPDEQNINGETSLISRGSGVDNQIWTEEDSNTWSAGDTIQFRVAVGEADFRDPPEGSNPDADKLEVIIVHTPSGAIISEHTFTP